MNNKIVLLEKDTVSQEIIEKYLEEYGRTELDQKFYNSDAFVEYIKITKPGIAIISDDATNNSLDLLQRLINESTNIIIISSTHTTDFIIKVIKSGAKAIIQKPIIKQEFFTSLDKCIKSEQTNDKSNIITIYSNKGGIGKTAIATNLAVELAKQTREKVVLVDLNFPLGDITTFMNIKPTISITSAIEKSVHSGKEAIINACRQYKDSSLYVLAEPIYLENSVNITQTHIFKLFETLRKEFSYVIVDMSANVDKVNMKILELSDLILLISIVNLPLIRNCQRCLDLFNNLGYDTNKTRIVINRYLENDEITINDVEKVLHQKVYWKIPNNYFAIMSSINKAMPVSEINTNSNVTLSFSGLANVLIEDLISNNINE